MTRSQLIDAIAAAHGLDHTRAEAVVRAIFDAMTEALRRGDGIELRGLGSFSVRTYRGYRGRNPRSGEIVEVSSKRLPHFKVGKPMRRRIAASARAVAREVARG